VFALLLLTVMLATQRGNAQDEFVIYDDMFSINDDVNLLYHAPSSQELIVRLERLLEPTTAVLQDVFGSGRTDFGATTLVRQFTIPVVDHDRNNYIQLGRLPEGVYVARIQQGYDKSEARIFVNRIGLVSKYAASGTTVWTTDLVTGEPVVADVYWTKSQVVRTNQDGLAVLTAKDSDHLLVARAGNSWALCNLHEIEPSKLYVAVPTPKTRAFLFTDRPTYHPGDMVHLRGVVLNENTRQPVAGKPFVIRIENVTNRLNAKIWGTSEDEELVTSPFGSFSFNWAVPSDATFGEYILWYFDDQIGFVKSARIRVEPDTGAALTVSLEPIQSRVIKGEHALFRIQAVPHVGDVSTGTQVRYSVARMEVSSLLYDTNWNPERETEFSYSDLYENGFPSWATPQPRVVNAKDLVFSDQAVLDQHGELTLNIPIKRETNGQAFEYVIKAEVTNGAGRTSSATQILEVLPADLKIKLEVLREPKRVGDLVPIRVITTDLRGLPIATAVKLVVERRRNDGSYKREIEQVVQMRTNTKGVGEAKVLMTNPENKFIHARGLDLLGRVLEAPGTSFNMETEADPDDRGWPNWDQQDLSLRLTQKTYPIGSTITASVENPFPGTPIFFTLETDRVKEARVVRSKERVVEFRVSASPEFFPSAYVTATMFHNATAFVGYKRAIINDVKNNLAIQIKTPELNRAGQTIPIQIHTPDSSGQGVISELSIAIVDESVFTMRPDDVPDMHEFLYRPRWRNVELTHSRAFDDGGTIYEPLFFFEHMDVRPDPTVRQVYSHFGTAFWAAALQTDANGDLTIPVTMPKTLGRWRITVRAHTMTGAVGEARTNFDTTQ
jgi:alpha-2-macroglobulin